MLFNYWCLALSNDIPNTWQTKNGYIDFLIRIMGIIVVGEVNIIPNKNLPFLIWFGTEIKINGKVNERTSINVLKSNLDKFIMYLSYEFNAFLKLFRS